MINTAISQMWLFPTWDVKIKTVEKVHNIISILSNCQNMGEYGILTYFLKKHTHTHINESTLHCKQTRIRIYNIPDILAQRLCHSGSRPTEQAEDQGVADLTKWPVRLCSMKPTEFMWGKTWNAERGGEWKKGLRNAFPSYITSPRTHRELHGQVFRLFV